MTKENRNRSHGIGEIIETSTLDFLAASQELHQPPALGELVKVQTAGEDYCYAVVVFGTTRSPDAGRRVIPRAAGDVRDEAIYDHHPQLKRLLQTTFHAKLVGWNQNGAIRQAIPPTPPPLHHTVYTCTTDEIATFTATFYYLRLLLDASHQVPPEHVISAHVQRIYAQRGDDDVWLRQAAREIAGLLKHDYDQLMSILYAIDPGE